MKILFYILRPIYGLVIAFRNYLYDSKILKIHTFPVPVFSIGNITVGGVGKTPMVEYLTKLLQSRNFKVGIVSRGYGRLSNGLQIVHDGKYLLSTPTNGGDEPFLLAKSLNNVPIIVDENRIRGINKIIQNYQVDVILLDDAYQHRRAFRDLDMLLISSTEKLKNYKQLPVGRLRESLHNSNRADLIIYTKTKDFRPPRISDSIVKITNTTAICSGLKYKLVKYESGEYVSCEIPTEGVHAFCGIGDPGSFTEAVRKLGIEIKWFKAFRDHRWYFEDDILKLSNIIKDNNGKSVLTTEKDLVKLPEIFLESFSIYILKMEVVFDETGRNVLEEMILEKFHQEHLEV